MKKLLKRYIIEVYEEDLTIPTKGERQDALAKLIKKQQSKRSFTQVTKK